MNRLKTFSLVLLSSLLFSTTVPATDWFRWRGPDLNGISKESDWQPKFPAEGPKQLWKANIGTGFSSFSVSNGRVYTMGNDKDTDTVFCFDAESGKEVWKHSYPCPLDPKYYEGGTSVTPAVDGDRVFTLSRKGDVFCLDAKTGKVVWAKNLEKELGVKIPTWGFAGSPLVEKNLLLLNVGSHGTALEKKTGKLIWTSDKTVSGYSTAVPTEYDGKRCAVFAGEKSVFAVTVADGKLVWEHPWKTEYDVNAAEPIISGDKVFISSGYNHGCAVIQIKGDKATVIWENKVLKNHINSSVLFNGFLYGFDGNAGPKADFRCVEFATGNVKWSELKLGAGALMIADGKLIIHTDKGELIIAEATPDSFKPISRAQVTGGRNWTTPVLSNGRIYCRNAKGDMVCLDVKK
jgi:outer membrane protein assembly factor BamB